MKISLWVWINKFNQSIAEDSEGRLIIHKTFSKASTIGKKMGKRGIDKELWELKELEISL